MSIHPNLYARNAGGVPSRSGRLPDSRKEPAPVDCAKKRTQPSYRMRQSTFSVESSGGRGESIYVCRTGRFSAAGGASPYFPCQSSKQPLGTAHSPGPSHERGGTGTVAYRLNPVRQQQAEALPRPRIRPILRPPTAVNNREMLHRLGYFGPLRSKLFGDPVFLRFLVVNSKPVPRGFEFITDSIGHSAP